jgi:putative ABC transport system permease protein
MLVAPADSLFRTMPREDPRVKPAPGFGRPQPFPLVTLWTAGGAGDARAVLAGAGLTDVAVATADTRRQQPQLRAAVAALGYQEALGWAAALVALVAFAVHADRTAAAGRLTDLFLVRVGLGARGVRRARALELLAMAAVAVVLALASVQLLRPIGARLLDPQRAATPPFELTVGPGVLAVAAGSVLVSVVVAALAGTARARRGTPEEALRDA